MSRLDDLPPDQHATLSLLLGQRKNYAEVAALLSIPGQAVHDRAHAALAVLAPGEARELTAAQREEIGDYLLGQQAGVAERLATRTYLDSSAPARAWAHAISEQIAPLSKAPLPEIPSGVAAPASPAGEQAAEATATLEEDARASGPRHRERPSSRLGGALLLAVIAAVVIVAVILIAGGGGSGKSGTATTAASASTTGAAGLGAATGASGPTEDNRLALTSPDPSSKAVGAVVILSEGDKHAFYLAAEHLPPTNGFFYAVWLYNSPSSHEALSKSPPVGSKGTLQGGALLPENADQFHQILLTRETSDRPSHPGPVVLSGPFSLTK